MTTIALTSKQRRRLEKCVETAQDSGMPDDQIKRLINDAGYIPYPWQILFHAAAREADKPNGPVDIGCGGARGPGKSHAVLTQAAIDDCQRVKRLKVLFLRQTGITARESFDDLIGRAVRGRVPFRKSANKLRFENGSQIVLGGFKDEKDIDKYIGIEYDVIIVEELTQLTFEKYQKLRGSLRTSKPDWRPRMYTSFNPGGVGHVWVRERYVLPYRRKKQTETRFIPSTYDKNWMLNKEYVDYLKSLQGALGKAWREGEWDVFAGMYFQQWQHDRHVVTPFRIPTSWFRFRSIDPGGRDGITSCHWYAVNQDGRVYVYREYYYGPDVINPKTGEKYGAGRDHDQHAAEIARLSVDENNQPESYRYTVIDTAAFAKAGFSETCAEIYERKGVTGLMPAAKERIVGWDAVNTYLRIPEDLRVQPKLQIFETCVNMVRTIPLLQHDEKHPEDVDTNGEDHAADELRYLLRTLREIKAQAPMTAIERRLKQAKQAKQSFDYSYGNN